MPEIEITPEQRDRLRSLQEDIARDVVGKYGHVRPRDAIEYLLDQYEREDAAATPTEEGVSESIDTGADTDDAGEDDLDASHTNAATDDGASESVAAASTDAAQDDDAADAAGTNGEAVVRVVGDVAAGAGGDDASNGEATATMESATTATGDGASTTSESAGGDSMLDQMLSLLDTHDDKWDESSSADERYAVELPDGDTEHVRTKDDVKALLFKHYR